MIVIGTASEIAERSGLAEDDVARKAVALAQQQSRQNADARTAHVGYFLIDRGRPALERITKARPSLRTLVARIGRHWPLLFYLSAILMIAAGTTAAFMIYGLRHGARAGLLWLLVPVVMCAVQIGVAIVNWFATAWVKPRPCPGWIFARESPPASDDGGRADNALDPEAIEGLIDGLEVRYLANRDPNLHFALLTDLEDAASEVVAGDDELVQQAAEGIEQLNEKYGADGNGIFFLFHRPRRWNAQEGVWMGYERKRGKLAEFNQMLRAAGDRFSASLAIRRCCRECVMSSPWTRTLNCRETPPAR